MKVGGLVNCHEWSTPLGRWAKVLHPWAGGFEPPATVNHLRGGTARGFLNKPIVQAKLLCEISVTTPTLLATRYN